MPCCLQVVTWEGMFLLSKGKIHNTECNPVGFTRLSSKNGTTTFAPSHASAEDDKESNARYRMLERR